MFTTRLELWEDPQPDFWVVGSPLIWSAPTEFIKVPVGARTDLASIPRILRNIPALDPAGFSRSGAVLHDWLYRVHGYTRAACDDILRRAIVAKGGSVAVARTFWCGVRLGGRSSYTCHDQGPTRSDFDTELNYLNWRMGWTRPLD